MYKIKIIEKTLCLFFISLLGWISPSVSATESNPSHKERTLIMVKSTIVNHLIQGSIKIRINTKGYDALELAMAYLEVDDSPEALKELLLLMAHYVGESGGSTFSCIVLEKGDAFKKLLLDADPANLRKACLAYVAKELASYKLTKSQEDEIKSNLCLTEENIVADIQETLEALTAKITCPDEDW